MKMYCQFYEVEIDIGCFMCFWLFEFFNMRYVVQVRNNYFRFFFVIIYCSVVEKYSSKQLI